MPFESDRWSWGDGEPIPARYLGRDCIRLAGPLALLDGLELADGVIEVDFAVSQERSFPGVVWRAKDTENYETFFVRPHQVGNPDAVQYTPVFNDVSAWQLYHAPGYQAPLTFPLGEWFRIRVVFAGRRAEVYVGGLEAPGLVIAGLKLPAATGRVGVFAGEPEIHVADFRYGGADEAILRSSEPVRPPAVAGVVPAWSVSDPFSEAELPPRPVLEPELLAGRTWTRLAVESSGLANLARVNGLRDGRDTVLASATVRSPVAQTVELELGFSDRGVVYLNGRALFRGDDGYRSRDYRFLGSIGWYDRLYLPLEEGDNELVVAVSEDFGGWGLQARFTEPGALSFG